jgi:hypothetical protein
MSNDNFMCEIADYGVFVAKKEGVCLRISVPSKTTNDWGSQSEFIDLPLMDKETFKSFCSAIAKFGHMYDVK